MENIRKFGKFECRGREAGKTQKKRDLSEIQYRAAGLGFEPRLTDPESVGLPLADPAICILTPSGIC